VSNLTPISVEENFSLWYSKKELCIQQMGVPASDCESLFQDKCHLIKLTVSRDLQASILWKKTEREKNQLEFDLAVASVEYNFLAFTSSR